MSTQTTINIYGNQALDRFAESLLAHLGLNNETAVDITYMAKKLGLNVYSASFEDNAISGYIKIEDGKQNIYVNNTHSIQRQRFTVAHEIAHFILHRHLLEQNRGTPMFRGGDSSIAEQEANRLAVAILMPQTKVREMYQNQKKTIQEMAELFWVSYGAMANRISSLGL